MWSGTWYVAWIEWAMLATCPQSYQATALQRIWIMTFVVTPAAMELLAYKEMRTDTTLVSTCLAIGLQLTGLINWIIQIILIGTAVPSSHAYVGSLCNENHARLSSIAAAIVYYQMAFYWLYHARVFPRSVTDGHRPGINRLNIIYLLILTMFWTLSSQMLPVATPVEVVSGATVGIMCAALSVLAMRLLIRPWVAGGLSWFRRIMCLGSSVDVYYSKREDHNPSWLLEDDEYDLVTPTEDAVELV